MTPSPVRRVSAGGRVGMAVMQHLGTPCAPVSCCVAVNSRTGQKIAGTRMSPGKFFRKKIAMDQNLTNKAAPDKQYLLAALRVGRTRLSLLRFELDEIGVLLENDVITPKQAEDWLFNIDALAFVTPSPTSEAVAA